MKNIKTILGCVCLASLLAVIIATPAMAQDRIQLKAPDLTPVHNLPERDTTKAPSGCYTRKLHAVKGGSVRICG